MSVRAPDNAILPDTGEGAGKTALVLAVTAFVALVLSIGVLAGISAERLAATLTSRLAGQLTIAVWGRGLESADAAAARAAELLTGLPGTHRVEILEVDEQDALLGAVIGGRSHEREQPRLISMSGTPNITPPNGRLLSLMNADRLRVSLDDHGRASGPLERQAWTTAGLGVAAVLLPLGGFVAACFVLGLRDASKGGPRVDLMMRLGAEPGFIGSTIARSFAWRIAVGALLGALCAAFLILAGIFQYGSPSSLAALILSGLSFGDCPWLALCPLVLTGLGVMAASFGARGGIARREREL